MSAEEKGDADGAAAPTTRQGDSESRSHNRLPNALKVRVGPKSGQARIAALKVRIKQECKEGISTGRILVC